MLSETEKKRIDELIKEALWNEDWEKAAKLTVALVFVETPTEKLVSLLQEAVKAYKIYYEMGKPMQDVWKFPVNQGLKEKKPT